MRDGYTVEGIDSMNDWGEHDGWPAPCKLNLFLHITGRRPDGYHQLQTLFQLLDWGDTLYFEPDDSGQIQRLNAIEGVPFEQDLIVRAARALREQFGSPDLGVSIRVVKRIPQGGGLGGGSSDAATTLLALNRLWSLNLEPEQLLPVGLSLGADVPVFLQGFSAWGEGVGEKLTALTLPEKWYLVVKPECEVPTAIIFQDSGLTRDTPHMKITPSYEELHNDCEAVVRKRFPKVGQMLDQLAEFGKARLTGTGACVFVECDNESAAEHARRKLPSECYAFVARGTNVSALHRIKLKNE
jgi:4-diphosphocytidyl-2-C-methyl-D-erythritol kinase